MHFSTHFAALYGLRELPCTAAGKVVDLTGSNKQYHEDTKKATNTVDRDFLQAEMVDL